ncbi:hypothetical protein [Clostridium sp. BL-8]|uniref:hyaluronate lyase N-terminal domain-containing protein n=1 Tax=Clostridium sp. BL-8 TaxID=349938 RepID=UPI00098BD7FE|nr:hypothetical protein [Clostridium sp. BL-8]OOM76570.1 hypothetical protein CLOBL_34550 [Clostridium sp. BL-8]
MGQEIQLKRGNNANLASLSLVAGEPAFVLDTGKLYIGNGTDKVLINPDQNTATTADKLTNARTIAFTGDVTGSGSFDGSGNISIVLTEGNTGVTAGTYPKVTVNAKGEITAGATLAASDIPTLTLSKISDAGTAASKSVGTASGNIPVLDSNGKLAVSVLPAVTINETYVVSSQSAMLALSANVGDIAIRTDLNETFILQTAGASTLSNWQQILSPTSAVTSVAGRTGAITLTSSDVGLGNVANESKTTMFTNSAFTGTPTAPTASAGTNTTQIATTAFVQTAISNIPSITAIDGGTF